jgi:hypothetical protein
VLAFHLQAGLGGDEGLDIQGALDPGEIVAHAGNSRHSRPSILASRRHSAGGVIQTSCMAVRRGLMMSGVITSPLILFKIRFGTQELPLY